MLEGWRGITRSEQVPSVREFCEGAALALDLVRELDLVVEKVVGLESVLEADDDLVAVGVDLDALRVLVELVREDLLELGAELPDLQTLQMKAKGKAKIRMRWGLVEGESLMR